MFLIEGLTEAKPDVFSLESLIAWLEKQPADGAYDYFDNCGCLITQYLRANGYPDAAVAQSVYRPNGYKSPSVKIPLPRKWDRVAEGDVGHPGWTFGAALTRARAAQASAVI